MQNKIKVIQEIKKLANNKSASRVDLDPMDSRFYAQITRIIEFKKLLADNNHLFNPHQRAYLMGIMGGNFDRIFELITEAVVAAGVNKGILPWIENDEVKKKIRDAAPKKKAKRKVSTKKAK